MTVLQVGVKAIIVNSFNECLLLKRCSKKYPEVTTPWDIVGGRIDPNFSLMENLGREIFEETGLQLTVPAKLLGAQDIIMTQRHIVRLTYEVLLDGLVTLSDEHDTFIWLPKNKLSGFPGLDQYLQKLLYDGLYSM